MDRCPWCTCNEKMIRYHDEEWGVPVYDDQKQFEFLMMEVMQCGLNWNMMIQKREIFRECFDRFDYNKVAEYQEAEIERILNTEGMIRSRRKIEAVIHNARCFQKIREEFGSFSDYIWGFTGEKTYLYTGHQKGEIPARNGLSDQISKDLKKRGLKYMDRSLYIPICRPAASSTIIWKPAGATGTSGCYRCGKEEKRQGVRNMKVE